MTILDEILKEERLAKFFAERTQIERCSPLMMARAVAADLKPRLEAALEAATLKIVGDDGEDL